jgi:hypothetical protein
LAAAATKLAIPPPIYWGTNTLAVLLLGSSVVGVTFGADGFYASNPATLPQILGQDLITLILGLPLLLGVVKLSHRGSLKGLLLWMGLLFYFAYSYYFYVVRVRLNGLFWAYVAIVALSLYCLLGLLGALQPLDIRSYFSRRTPTRPIAIFLLVMAGIFTAFWIGLTLSRLFSGTFLNPVERHVIGLDGMVLLPLMVIGGWQLLQNHPWGYLLAGLLLTKLATLGFTRLITTGMLAVWQQPIDLLQTFLFGLVMVGALMSLVAYLDGIMTPVSRKTQTNASRNSFQG